MPTFTEKNFSETSFREPNSPEPHSLLLSVGALPALGAATGRGDNATPASAPFISAPLFVDTWIARPVRHVSPPVARDFTFKAVIGEPEW